MACRASTKWQQAGDSEPAEIYITHISLITNIDLTANSGDTDTVTPF